jgi:CheY-like chemotaxis protein
MLDDAFPPSVRCRILHVTSNTADNHLLSEVLSDHPEVCLSHAISGEEALKALDQAPHTDAQPNVVFLSWYLAAGGMSGEDVLTTLKSNDKLRAFPVVIFTSTLTKDQVTRMYLLGANCVMNKPLNWDEYETCIRSFAFFWTNVAVLPFCEPRK